MWSIFDCSMIIGELIIDQFIPTKDMSYTDQRQFTDHMILNNDPTPVTDHLQPFTNHHNVITDHFILL